MINKIAISSSVISCKSAAVSRLILITALIMSLGLFISCGSNDKNDAKAPESDINADFYFLVISDLHVRLPGNPDDIDYNSQGNLDNLTQAINRINTDFSTSDFVAVTGDIVGCLFSEDTHYYGIGMDTPAERYKSMIDILTIPVYSALGNHDYQKGYDPDIGEGISSLDQEAIEAVWKKVLGTDPYYSVEHKGVRLIFANSNRGNSYTDICPGCIIEMGCTGSFDAEQIAWLREELANPEPAIIFIHHPPITDLNMFIYFGIPSHLIDRNDDFYDVVEDNQENILGIFTGHGHVSAYDTLGSVKVYETGAIGDRNSNKDNINIVEVSVSDKRIRATLAK